MIGAFVQLNDPNGPRKRQPVGYVVTESGCWEWVGHRDRNGYGKVSHYGYAHRKVYEMTYGKIAAETEIDHLCNNRTCVRPDHLESVSREENVKRAARRRLFCRNGHKRTEENTLVSTEDGATRRRCRVCQYISGARSRARLASSPP